MELWGGVECTVNRTGDRWTDQLELTGHAARPDDLDRIIELGITTLRYPILWERIAPDHPDLRNWDWSDARLAALRERGVRVIAGLIHHGSGPHYTTLTAPNFAPGLAAHARAVAQRYPWIEDWTPVNEPVTTARFSAQYGYWHPHARDERTFWLALLNQIDATRGAIAAVRSVNPGARLIQTDDLGRTYATASLREQAAFDNLRRWAGWDLLCGRVTREHPLFDRLDRMGLGERLRVIADDPCPPDIIGINHYLTSDRFLDHRVRRYPERDVGGNGRVRYVDLEAIRVLDPAPQGLTGAIEETWRRYRIPIAVTEVHNGCTREEQMRWMAQAWQGALELREAGVDLRAVTSWALLGSQGWDTLLTRPGRYEAGAFDVSGGEPRLTAQGRLLEAIARGEAIDAFAGQPGWWQRPVRFVHPPVPRPAPTVSQPSVSCHAAGPILICGATGTLGRALAAACEHRNLPHVLTARGELDLHDAGSIDRTLDGYQPRLVINAAGWVRVDDAEAEADACMAANGTGAVALAEACDARGIPTVSFSSDLVFDGRAGGGYHEGDATAPLNVYGQSKVAAEEGIGALAGDHLVVRTAAFFSPHDPYNFAWAVADALSEGRRFSAADDCRISPTYVPHLVDAVLDLGIDQARGIWHLAGDQGLSWSEFAQRIAEACDLDATLIDAVPGATFGWPAARPDDVTLVSRRGVLLPPLDHGLARFAAGFAAQQARQRIAA